MHPDTHPDDWNWHSDCYEDELPMADRIRRAEGFDPVRRPGDAAVLRHAMDFVAYARFCPKPRCSRARRCMDDHVECAWRKLPYLQRYYFPAVRHWKAQALAERMALDGACQKGA